MEVEKICAGQVLCGQGGLKWVNFYLARREIYYDPFQRVNGIWLGGDVASEIGSRMSVISLTIGSPFGHRMLETSKRPKPPESSTEAPSISPTDAESEKNEKRSADETDMFANI